MCVMGAQRLIDLGCLMEHFGNVESDLDWRASCIVEMN